MGKNNRIKTAFDNETSNKKRKGKDVPKLPFLVSLFLVSSSLFIYQVTLTRAFSPMLRYHYVFLIISLAIFGMGIGGFLAYHFAQRTSTHRLRAQLPALPTVLASTFVVVFALIYKLPFIQLYFLYGVIATLPFITGGFFIALIFFSQPLRSHELYFADLLGAAVGGAVAVISLNHFGLMNTVLLVSVLALAASIFLSVSLLKKKQTIPYAVTAVLLVLAILLQPAVSAFEQRFTGYFTSPFTALTRMRQANDAHTILTRSWDAYSRTDVIENERYPDRKFLTIDGGSNSAMMRFDGRLTSVSELRSELNYLPFGFGATSDVLLIGPGGGKDILMALLGGSSEIHAVEINSGSVWLTREYAYFNGNIYDRKEVTLHIQDGRNFMKQTQERYDVIYLAQVVTQVAESVGYALAENFIYTKQALREYWNALSENGKLAFVLHGEFELARLLNTITVTLEEQRVPKWRLRNHIVVINRTDYESGGEIHMPLVLVKKSPFSPEEINEVRVLSASSRSTPLFLPDSASNLRWIELVYPRQNVPKARKINVTPTSDNRPYFFDFKRGVEPNLLIFLGIAFMIALLFFRPILKKNGLKRTPLYFLGLGLGFMLIEIPLVQRFGLLLGHPTRSFVITIPALLVGGGLGSLVSPWKRFSINKRYLPLLLVPTFVVIVYLLQDQLVSDWFIHSLALRIFFSIILLFPLGFFLGMPFPTGIRMLGMMNRQKTIPLIWGLNGTMSIGGSVLAVILSMKIGFSYSLAVGGLIYLLLFLFMPFDYNGRKRK